MIRRLGLPLLIGLAWLALAPVAFAQSTATPTPTPTPTATPIPIDIGLVSCWDLNESSGVRYDAYGSNHLTDNNTVDYVGGGRSGNAASLVAANQEYLSIADNASLSVGDTDFTAAIWIKLVDEAANRAILGKWDVGNTEYLIFWARAASPNRIKFYVRSTNNAIETILSADNYGTPQTGIWQFVVVWHDAARDELGIQVNNGIPNILSYSLGIRDSSAPFTLGYTPGAYYTGQLDTPAIWKRVLSTSERTWLYNSGYGRPCADLVHPSVPTPTSTPTIPALTYVILSSGDVLRVDRQISFGDIAVAIAVGLLILIMSLSKILEVVEKWLS